MSRLVLWSYAGVILLLGTVILGSFTRAYGAGLACGPEWPTCSGEILPSLDFMVALEYFHRIFAALGFITVLYASYLALKHGGAPRKWAIATVAALTFQVILGAIVVWYHLSPPLSALHTTTAIVTVALATGMAVSASLTSGKTSR